MVFARPTLVALLGLALGAVAANAKPAMPPHGPFGHPSGTPPWGSGSPPWGNGPPPWANAPANGGDAPATGGDAPATGGDAPLKDGPVFVYGGETPVRGVNLGGWLVLEPWIVPSLFDNLNDSAIVDEWTFTEKLGAKKAKKLLQQHWDTWITEKDFKQIAALGLNHVRVPVGFWAFDVSGGEPYVTGHQMSYLKKAVKWAKKYKLKVMLDLHGAPGSENGFDNSGRFGNATWHTSQDNIDRTKAAVQSIVDEFAQDKYKNEVVSIGVLNEPSGFRGPEIVAAHEAYSQDVYNNVRKPFAAKGDDTKSNLAEVISDCFQPLPTWKDFMQPPAFENVVLDTHIYHVFGDEEIAWNMTTRIQAYCDYRGNLTESNSHLPTIVGEWSTAPTDCAKYLNGRNTPARFATAGGDCTPKTGDGSGFSKEYLTDLRKMYEVQRDVFESASGWIYWAWKTEQAADWSYKDGVRLGFIPKEPTERKFPDLCKK